MIFLYLAIFAGVFVAGLFMAYFMDVGDFDEDDHQWP